PGVLHCARKGSSRARPATPRARRSRSQRGRAGGSVRSARRVQAHALRPTGSYPCPWRVPPVAALAGGVLVVHFTNRKNVPLLFSTRPGTRPTWERDETEELWNDLYSGYGDYKGKGCPVASAVPHRLRERVPQRARVMASRTLVMGCGMPG